MNMNGFHCSFRRHANICHAAGLTDDSQNWQLMKIDTYDSGQIEKAHSVRQKGSPCPQRAPLSGLQSASEESLQPADIHNLDLLAGIEPCLQLLDSPIALMILQPSCSHRIAKHCLVLSSRRRHTLFFIMSRQAFEVSVHMEFSRV